MKVLVCDNIDKLGVDFIERCRDIMPEWRREQMDRYKHLKGKVQCAAAWLLVWSLEFEVWNRDGLNPFTNKWIYNKFGKPYFEGRDDLFFSVSHCGNAVAAVISDEEVGIDIEEISRYRESLVKYTLSDEEFIDWSLEFGAGGADEFIKIWTRKEAAFKCYGTGITHEIKDILKKGDLDIYSTKVGDDKWLSVATKQDRRKNEQKSDISIEISDAAEILKTFMKRS